VISAIRHREQREPAKYNSKRGRNMPKMKTHKGAKKRFVVSSTGKVKHKHCGTGHLAWRKTTKQRRQLRGSSVVSDVDAKRIVNVLIPSGK